MLRFCDADVKSINKIDENTDCLTMDNSIWEQGRTYFKYHRDIQKVPVVDRNGSLICYAFQDADANRELRMLQELGDSKKAIHFEDVYSGYSYVIIQECNELAYYFALYLKNRGIGVKTCGKYWDQIAEWNNENACKGSTLTIYAEGTWQHNENLSYELMRSVSVEFEYIDNIYKENIRRGYIVNAKCSFEELIKELRGKEIILIGTGNRVQDIYDMLMAEGLDIEAFLSAAPKNGLRLLGKEVIGVDDLEKYTNPVFIELGKNSALGDAHLDEYVYYGCKRNRDFFFFQDYADLQRNNLLNVLKKRRIVLLGEPLLSTHLKQFMVDEGKDSTTIQYYKALEKNFNGQGVIGIIVALQAFGIMNSAEKWKEEVDKYVEILKEYDITDYTLYFTMTNSLIRSAVNGKKYTIAELKPKGILIGAINAFCGNIFFRDCIDNHPNIIQFGYNPFENDMFYYCIRLAQIPAERVVPTLFDSYKDVAGEEWFQMFFPDPDVFRKKCETVLKGKKNVTSQELFVLFAIAYNEMMGRQVDNIRETYIYWEPHGQDISLKTSYMNWLGDEQVRNIAVYVSRNGLISAASGLRYSYQTSQKLDLTQMIITLLSAPCMLEIGDGTSESIVLKFEDLKVAPRETWLKLCNKLAIPWSDTFLNTTRFGKVSYFYRGNEKVTTGYDLTPVYRDCYDLFSPFDKMRICYCKWEYQKKYGYDFDSVAFSRKELQELYLKEFKCQRVLEIKAEERDYFETYKYIQKRLNEIYTDIFWASLV